MDHRPPRPLHWAKTAGPRPQVMRFGLKPQDRQAWQAWQAWQVRQVANLLNGSTLVGCAVAKAGGARIAKGPRGVLVGTGYRLPVPVANAFTVGNVITSKHDRGWLDDRPALMRHEERHTWQYVACLGLPMLPLYLLAAGWSYLRGGDFAVHNPFERLAGLEDGGYPGVSARARRQAQSARAARSA